MTMDSRDAVSVGSRLSISSFLCTILYIGEVHGTSGTWYGVEWDDPSRGKHSGTHDGKTYFSTRVPGAGSFIRPGKKTDGERNFLEALKDKYATNYQYEHVVLEASGKEIEMIGFDKVEHQQSNLQELLDVVLDSMLIRYANSFEDIQTTCPQITSLDLSRNLFISLATVAEICRPLQNLRSLRLTGNRLWNIALSDELSSAFQKVEWLSLNLCCLYWDEIESILEWFTRVKHVEIGFNRLPNPSRTIHLPPSLETLILESNEISSLQILDFLDAKGLQKLSLAENHLNESLPGKSHNVSTLNLSETSLSSWDFLSQLSVIIPHLTSLRITTKTYSKTHHLAEQIINSLIIARFPHLLVLNGSKITPLERENSELFYLSKIFGTPEEQRESVHPRYKSLVEKYGAPVANVKNTIGATNVEIMLVFEGRRVDKQVPRGIRISALRGVMARSLGVSMRKRRIIVEEEGRRMEVSDGDASRDLGWFVSGRKASIIIE